MSSDERLISKKQRFQEDDEEPSPKHWLFFQQFLDEVESWREFKFVITTRSKANYIWYKYSNEPANKMAQSQAGTLFLTPASSEDMTAICEKAEALFDEDLFKFALPVVALGCYDNRSKIAKAITTYLTLQKATNHTVETLHTTKLSKTKPSEVISFIPELSYFQEHYPKLTALNLSKDDFMLWLYAQPERDMMGLHIGRAASLPQGGIMAGDTEPVLHSYRNVLILKGQPFIGKSWFNNWLINGLEHCGLTTSVIHDLGRQFGHGQWVSSAWSYLDDTTETMISHFFNSSILKTVASNGLVNVEAKGVDHITVKAFTAPILLANNIDTRHLANCDEGNANRIKIVACKDLHGCVIEAKQLPITSPLYGIESVIPAQIYIHLANKAEVSQEVLAMYFIRLCLDYFESFSMQEMSEKINKISQELYASYTTNGINILAKSAVLSYLLKNSLSKTQVQELQVKFSEAGNSAPFILDSLITLADLESRLTYNSQGMIKALIKQHWLKTGKDSTHPWVTHRNYSTYFLTKLGTIAETQIENLSRKGRDSVPLEKVYQTIFSELRDVDGNPSVYSISRIQDAWRAALVLNFNYVVEVYNFIKSELVRLKKPELLQLYRDHRMFFGELFTEISKSDKSPIVEIPDDYFFTYEAPDPMALFNDPTIF